MDFRVMVQEVPITSHYTTVLSIDAGEKNGGLLVFALGRIRGRLHWLLCLNQATFSDPLWGKGLIEGFCTPDDEEIIRDLLKLGRTDQFNTFIEVVLGGSLLRLSEGERKLKEEALVRHGVHLW
jgi:hypothetical protein